MSTVLASPFYLESELLPEPEDSVEAEKIEETERSDLSTVEDYALAQASASGEMRAFEELYRRHRRRVYSVCLRMTRNSADAEDLTQAVFVNLFSKIGSFRGESAFATWLHRM